MTTTSWKFALLESKATAIIVASFTLLQRLYFSKLNDNLTNLIVKPD